MNGSSRIPSLGRRGEGWVVGQFLLLALIAVLGVARLAQRRPTGELAWLRVILGSAGMVGGLAVGWQGVRALGPQLTALPRPPDEARLIEHDIYGRIRHPMYAALVLVASGWSLLTASLGAAAATVALAAWLDLKARREEQWLAERFARYGDYRRRTGRFIPRVS